MSGKRILVTGSEGFIGKSLCARLMEYGHEVVRFDKVIVGDERKNILVRGSWGEIECGLDLVIHLAAQTSVYDSVSEIPYDAETNILGTIETLEFCKRNKLRLIYAASGGTCYGRVGGGLLEMMPSESVLSCDNSPYGFSKQVGEAYCELYDMLFDVKYYSLRLSNIFGIDGKGIVEKWLKLIQHNRSDHLYINGTGEQTRDFVYIDDCVEAFIKAIPNILEPECSSQVMNISSGKAYKMIDVAKIICEVTGFDVLDKVSYKPTIRYEVDDHTLKNEIAQQMLGWWSKISLEEGIKLIWEKLQHESTHTTLVPSSDLK